MAKAEEFRVTSQLLRAAASVPANVDAITRDARRAANQAKRDAKRARHHGGSLTPGALSFRPRALATGSIGLIDVAGLKYFINTNITFSTSSSASGAASEASYQAPIVASTVGGGVTVGVGLIGK